MNFIPLLLSLLILTLPQQRSVTSSVRGTITSESSGKPIAYATVKLSRSSGSTHSDEKGEYTLSDVFPATYNLTFSAPGFIPLTFLEMTIPPSTSLGISVKLRDSKGAHGKSIAIKFSEGPNPRPSVEDRMLFYQPDSTIDYKIRIINPELRSKGSRPISYPDSSRLATPFRTHFPQTDNLAGMK